MNWIKTLALALVFIFGVGSNDSSFAQGSAETNQEEIELTRSIIKVQKKQIIAKNMNLTSDEKDQFWAVYREYQNQMNSVSDRRVKLITDYADNINNNNLTDAKASEMLDEFLSYEAARIALKKSFVGKFRQILPSKKVTRFFQLENKLEDIINFELARQIPLVQ